MNNETKLTASDLALYMGCECQTSTRTGTIDIVNSRGFCIVLDGVYSWSEPIKNIKPILRPLSDMTDEEEKEFVPLCAGSQIARFSRDQSGASNWRQWIVEFENGDVDHLIMNESGETWFRSYFESAERRRNWSNTINQHKQTVWLLRHHFDLFGWIPAGLAIDKTKTVTP